MTDILTLGKITTLALADSVNPCEIAVLTMVLITILMQNPEKRKRVLFGGLAFISAVFIGYLFYGTVMINLFGNFNNFLKENSIFLYDALAIFAMIIGALNIKDYFMYKPGGFATEMPLSMRPRVRILIKKMTSPGGTFIIGFLVTIFLLPCTIGPYIIASGILAPLGIWKALPWLLYYNFLFVLPMIAIVLLVYFGFKEVDEISGWKERNIKRLHLVAGILLFAIGLALLMGWI